MSIFSRKAKKAQESTSQASPESAVPEVQVGPADEYFFTLVMAEIEATQDRGERIYSLSYSSNLPMHRKIQAKFGEDARINRAAVEKLLLEREGLVCVQVQTLSGGYRIDLPTRQVSPTKGSAEDALRAREARATQRRAAEETEASILTPQIPQLVPKALDALRQHGFPAMKFQTRNQRITWNGQSLVAWQLSSSPGDGDSSGEVYLLADGTLVEAAASYGEFKLFQPPYSDRSARLVTGALRGLEKGNFNLP